MPLKLIVNLLPIKKAALSIKKKQPHLNPKQAVERTACDVSDCKDFWQQTSKKILTITKSGLTAIRQIGRNENRRGLLRVMNHVVAQLKCGHPNMAWLARGVHLAGQGMGPSEHLDMCHNVQVMVRSSTP